MTTIYKKDSRAVRKVYRGFPALFTIALLGSQALPSAHAASTGWDCITTPAGVYECSPAKAEPKQTEPAPVIESTPLAEEPEAKPVPVEGPGSQQAPESEVADTPAKPEPEVAKTPEPAKPESPAIEPESEPKVVESPKPVAEPETTPTPEVAKPEAPAVEPESEPKVVELPKPVAEPKAESGVTQTPAKEPAEPVATKPAEKQLAPLSRAEGALHKDPIWALCGPSEQPNLPDETPGGETSLTADDARIEKNKPSVFTGNVQIRQPGRALDADKVIYDRDRATVDAKGNVYYRTNKLGLLGDSAFVNLEKGDSTFEDGKFKLYNRHARGTAKTLIYNGNEKLKLKQVTYTTCNEGSTDWEFKAKTIDLNQDTGVGTAKNVSVRFKDVPIFYSPVLTFPIDDRRKSGFLAPSFGNSDNGGAEFAIPYYWNIAPNQDATITPRILAKRGVQLQGEYRFLTERTNGQVNAEFLPSDNQFNDNRTLFSLQHQARLNPNLSTDVNYNYVSDSKYFEDLGTDITVSSTTFLERRGDINYSPGYGLSALFRLQGFQTVDASLPATSRPYQRLPQLIVNGNWYDVHGFDYSLHTEAVYFDRNDSVTGTRIDLLPSVSLPLRNSYAYAIPKLSLRHTRYELSNSALNRNDSPTRTVPYASIDSGLFFEREGSWGSRAYIQTLEPRLYYLYVPYRDQNNLIVDRNGNSVVFDTGEFDFSFAQLFREDRFTGADRVGDANQITAALTTRILEPGSSLERFRASIGQIYYFRDRDVVLPNTLARDNSTSDFIAELAATFTNELSASAAYQYNTDTNQTQRGTAALRYQSGRKIVNLAYRFRRDFLEQSDVSVVWPLNRKLSAVGRWNYSLDKGRTIDGYAGLEFESCCYIVRAIARQYLSDLNGNANNAVLVQLELKGLTSLGQGVKELLGEGILGYDRKQ